MSSGRIEQNISPVAASRRTVTIRGMDASIFKPRAPAIANSTIALHAIRDPQAAWVLARHDSRLRAEIARGLTEYLARAGRTLTADPDEVARLLIALREGALAQAYVEPELLPPGRLERQFLAPLLAALSAERTH